MECTVRYPIFIYTLCSKNLLFQVLATPAARWYRGRFLCYKQRTDGGTELPDKAMVLLVDYGNQALVSVTTTTWTWTGLNFYFTSLKLKIFNKKPH